MRHIDLFSGIGGFALASSWVWGSQYENVAHSDIEEYACKVYHRHFPESECLGDITKIDWTRFKGIDLITGGFPCQPHSVAGKRKASEDERDLWSECVRAIRILRPRYAVFENVPGLFVSERGRFFGRVLADLASCGYDVEYRVLSAADVGAPHKRERIWIVCSDPKEVWPVPSVQSVQERKLSGEFGRVPWEDWVQRLDSSNFVGTTDGIPGFLDRHAGLGNSIVPQVAYVILSAIKKAERAQTKLEFV